MTTKTTTKAKEEVKGGEGGDRIRRSRSGSRRRRRTPLSDVEIDMINGHWVDTDITSNMHRLIEMNDAPTITRVLEEVSEFFFEAYAKGMDAIIEKGVALVCLFVLFELTQMERHFPPRHPPFFFLHSLTSKKK